MVTDQVSIEFCSRSSNNELRTLNRVTAPVVSIFGVIGGTVIIFRYLSPNKDGSFVSDEDRQRVRGGSNGQSPFGTVAGRPPRSTGGSTN
jgi:hypothetical protein